MNDKPFQSSYSYIQRKLSSVSIYDVAKTRFEIDISDILTGPLCGAKAEYVAKALLKSNNPIEVAFAMQTAARRFLGDPWRTVK